MVQFLGPETDIMCQFLGPETDIMGERYYIMPADNWSNFLFGSGVCNVGYGLVSGSELINPIFVVDNSTDSQN
jgi:hypothetical protein